MNNTYVNFDELTDTELVEVEGGLAPAIVAAIIAGSIAVTTWGYGKVQDYAYRQGYNAGYNS